MITTIADMLKELQKKEEEALLDFQEETGTLKQPTLIGSVYEGTAQELLENSLFEGLDLRVVSGQIINKNKERSSQIDCMIVEGEGKKIPMSKNDDWIYDISQVIAVVEVKKNLYKSDLKDSYEKMRKIMDIYDPKDMTSGEFNLFRDSFRSIVGMDLPDQNDLKKYSYETQMMYHTLLMESVTPLRIVFGFYGYKTMKNLREGFTDFLHENISTDLSSPIKGFGPNSFPSLIFNENSSLIKLNGMPYNSFIDDNGFWEVVASSVNNPLLHLLEVLWTKLAYKHRINNEIFGEDMELEGLYRYLRTKPIKKGGNKGWEFTYIELPKDMQVDAFYTSWEPEEISEAEHLLIQWLCSGERMNTEGKIFADLVNRYNLNANEFLKGLRDKKLVYKDTENELDMLTDECVAIIKDGKIFAGENKDGKMAKWMNQN